MTFCRISGSRTPTVLHNTVLPITSVPYQVTQHFGFCMLDGCGEAWTMVGRFWICFKPITFHTGSNTSLNSIISLGQPQFPVALQLYLVPSANGEEGDPDRWKCMHCHLWSRRCHTRVSSLCCVWAWPCLSRHKMVQVNNVADVAQKWKEICRLWKSFVFLMATS